MSLVCKAAARKTAVTKTMPNIPQLFVANPRLHLRLPKHALSAELAVVAAAAAAVVVAAVRVEVEVEGNQ
jgi:hypothetical protein